MALSSNHPLQNFNLPSKLILTRFVVVFWCLGVRMLHFFKDWWKFIQIQSNHTNGFKTNCKKKKRKKDRMPYFGKRKQMTHNLNPRYWRFHILPSVLAPFSFRPNFMHWHLSCSSDYVFDFFLFLKLPLFCLGSHTITSTTPMHHSVLATTKNISRCKNKDMMHSHK